MTIHNLGHVAGVLANLPTEESKLHFQQALDTHPQHSRDDHVELAATTHTRGHVA